MIPRRGGIAASLCYNFIKLNIISNELYSGDHPNFTALGPNSEARGFEKAAD